MGSFFGHNYFKNHWNRKFNTWSLLSTLLFFSRFHWLRKFFIQQNKFIFERNHEYEYGLNPIPNKFSSCLKTTSEIYTGFSFLILNSMSWWLICSLTLIFCSHGFESHPNPYCKWSQISYKNNESLTIYCVTKISYTI